MHEAIPDRWSVGLESQAGASVPMPAQPRPVRTVAVHYDHFGTGGAEKVTAEQLAMFVRLGYRTILYTNDPAREDDQPLPAGVERHFPPSENDDHEARFAFWQGEVETQHIDFCLYNSWVSGWMQFDCWAFARLGVPFVLYCHSLFTSWFGDDTADYLARALPWAAKRCAAIICTNEASASFFSAIGGTAVLMMNPLASYLEPTRTERAPRGQTVLWVGRMSEEKRPGDLLAIMERVHEARPQARMVVVGAYESAKGPQPQTLERQAQEAGLAECMEFTGFREPYEYLANASVYVQTSEYEGFSLSLAEAMSFGLPCVTYDYDYLPLLAGNAGAVRVPVGDTQAAADAIVRILEDPQLAASMGKASLDAYERVAAWDMDAAYRMLLAGVEAGSMPSDLLFSHQGSEVDAKRMTGYFLQGVRLACDERHRLQWGLEYELELADERISALEADKAELHACIEELVNSKSYRLGRALTAPYRAFLEGRAARKEEGKG